MNEAMQRMREDRKHRESMQIQEKAARAEQESARQLQAQTQKYAEMVEATFAMVEKQQQANELQKESNALLKQQIEFLEQQNKEQAKELKKSKFWQVAAWVVTTIIAIGAIVVPLIELIHTW